MVKFPFSDDNKRYHTLNYHNKTVFGCRIAKATVNAGFSCPHGGCIFCAGAPEKTSTVEEQFEAEKARINAKFPDAKIILYYGQGTNTFCSDEQLSELLHTAQQLGAFGVSLATRPDCIDSEKARILAEFPLPVTVELGVQTAHDVTAARICRGYDFALFSECYGLLKSLGVRVCVHIMNGLPGENMQMMTDTAKILGKLRPDGVKIHLTHVLKNTELYEMYLRGEYVPMEQPDYIETVVRQLELFPPETVIERVTGDGDKSLLIAPLWSRDKISTIGGIDKRMNELDTFQGRLYNE